MSKNNPSMARWFAGKFVGVIRKIPRFMGKYVKYYLFIDDEYGYLDRELSVMAHMGTMFALLVSGIFMGVAELMLIAILSFLAGMILGAFSLLKAEYRKEMNK